MKRLLFAAITATSLFFIVSCNKTNDKSLTPQQVDSVKIFGFDSTKLIKSLTYIYTDSSGNEIDSISEYFYYDTINKKIIAADQIITGPNPVNYFYILSYNSSYRLSNFSYNPSLLTDPKQMVSVDYQYDAQNILSGEMQVNKDGSRRSFDITKTVLPSGGYSLRGSNSNGQDSLVDTYSFNPSGQLMWWSDTLEPGQVFTRDSLIYDAKGNIMTVMENTTFLDTPFKRFDFSGRDTIGNELSDFNKVLFNGMVSFNADSFSFIASILDGDADYDFYQFTDYPAASTTAYIDYDASYKTFDTKKEFDSLNRLISYKMYENMGSGFFNIIKLTYYK